MWQKQEVMATITEEEEEEEEGERYEAEGDGSGEHRSHSRDSCGRLKLSLFFRLWLLQTEQQQSIVSKFHFLFLF